MKTDANPDPSTRGVTDISKLLQRQAEELSRLSQQLSGTPPTTSAPPGGERDFGAEKPPVQIWPVPGKGAPVSESHLPMLASDPALSADSLPVLDAFRQFLEEERRRTRRRMIRLMMVGGLIVLGIMAVVAWGISRSIRETRRDLQVTQLQATQQVAKQTEQVGKISMTASNLERRLSLERQKVQSIVVAATNLQKVLESETLRNEQTRSQMSATINDQQEEIQRLKEMITTMEIDNALLMGSVKELQGEEDPGKIIEPEAEAELPTEGGRVQEGPWITTIPAGSLSVLPPPESPPGARVPFRLPNP